MCVCICLSFSHSPLPPRSSETRVRLMAEETRDVSIYVSSFAISLTSQAHSLDPGLEKATVSLSLSRSTRPRRNNRKIYPKVSQRVIPATITVARRIDHQVRSRESNFQSNNTDRSPLLAPLIRCSLGWYWRSVSLVCSQSPLFALFFFLLHNRPVSPTVDLSFPRGNGTRVNPRLAWLTLRKPVVVGTFSLYERYFLSAETYAQTCAVCARVCVYVCTWVDAWACLCICVCVW